MPSPIGHFIAGVSAGWLVAGVPAVAEAMTGKSGLTANARTALRGAALFGTLAVAADLDLLVGARTRAGRYPLYAQLALHHFEALCPPDHKHLLGHGGSQRRCQRRRCRPQDAEHGVLQLPCLPPSRLGGAAVPWSHRPIVRVLLPT